MVFVATMRIGFLVDDMRVAKKVGNDEAREVGRRSELWKSGRGCERLNSYPRRFGCPGQRYRFGYRGT